MPTFKKIVTPGGGGCFYELIGLLICFTVIGIPLGLFLIYRGHKATYSLSCSDCGTVLSNKNIKMCPGCKGYFRLS